jgi:two-component system response regulator NreC
MIKVLLAEDHIIVRKGLYALLKKEIDIKVIGEAGDGREAVEMVEKLRPDVVLMDISMPSLNGIEATRRIKKNFPNTKVLILTMHETEEYIFQLLRVGASGYVVKMAAPAELISAIHAVHRGHSFLSPSISKKVINEYRRKADTGIEADSLEQLTNRERETLQLIAEGNSNREIAEMLFISIKTVETHRTHLMNKLNIHNTAELTQYAIRKGILNIDDKPKK